MKQKICFGCLLCLSFFIIGITAKVSIAATITGISFKGGGCMFKSNGCNDALVSADWDEINKTVTVFKNFSKSASEEEEEGGGSSGGSCGNGNGACGKSDQAGGGETETEEPHEHDSTFERQPPIHMFITLENSGNGSDTYTFNESIFNNTGIAWSGFLFALKQNEVDGAELKKAEFVFTSADSDGVFVDLAGGKGKLEWSNGSYLSSTVESLKFSFDITFMDVNMDDSEGKLSVLLQEFPLIASAPVPEPGTLLLFGAGLIGIAGVGRRIDKK